MKMVNSLFVEQQQKLMMTPELRQAIAILQMSTLELNEYIQNELEENPFLEEKDLDDLENNTENSDEDEAIRLEEWLEVYHDRDIDIGLKEQKEEKTYENYLTKAPSLFEHLEFQMHLVDLTEEEIEIGIYLIGNLDHNGYLCIDLNEVAHNLKVSLTKTEEVLQVIHSFHPHGVGARNLEECLLLQLKHYGKESEIACKIIENHLDDLAKGKLNKIACTLAISVQQTQEICDLIRTLDPKPGYQYSSDQEIRYIVPEVFVENIDGEYVVYANDLNYPRLIVSRLYENILRQPGSFSDETRKYFEEKMGSALWLIRSIEQRKMTLDKVARCIVDVQSEFLDRGIQYLKPLKLQQIAQMANVHESTVSRATTNKYIQTPQGLYELKYFFSSGMDSYHGMDRVSSKSIKHMLEGIIDNEDNMKPFSDEQIAQLFKEKGIRISRRTVAKYRQELGIPSTMSRKRY
ncbi:MAG: RNA polymerase factor sigma-54 [Syntrophomonadaceae bacterium]|jgi:RNA polymerase sigma-54 factor|nr:RNA polymerase factor sigma-54 [Syntrophomonadaceae bacterium]